MNGTSYLVEELRVDAASGDAFYVPVEEKDTPGEAQELASKGGFYGFGRALIAHNTPMRRIRVIHTAASSNADARQN